MFKTIIAGINGAAGDADVIALAELLAAPGARLIPTRVPPLQAPADGLHDAATSHGADLIVVGSSSRGRLGRILVGDDASATLRSAPCAVAVAPHGFALNPHAIARVGVGYDGSARARAAMDSAKLIAARNGAEVRALGVAMPLGLVPPIGTSAFAALEASREQTERCIAQLEPGIVADAVEGVAEEKLAELSSEVDLLVVGSSRRGAIGRVLLGSTSEQLSREASCPLLVVPAPGSSPHAPERPDQQASAPAT
jgi:nucleotide-binding universal stress UspA family protein